MIESWKKQKLRYLIELKSGDFIKSETLLETHKYPVYGGNGISGYSQEYNYEDETLVIGRVGAHCGNVYHINEKVWITDNALICQTVNDYRFMYYVLNSLNLNNLANKTAQPVITGTKVKSQYISFPKKNIQKEIADFLDKQTSKIDSVIKTKEQQLINLEELKKSIIHKSVTKGLNNSVEMKDSKIEWIGDIPRHWKKDKLFRVTEFVSSGGTPTSTNPDYYDGEIVWIQTGDLNDGYIFETSKKITQKGLDNSSAKIFKEGILLIAMYGATIGKLGIMTEKAATNQACCAINLNSKIDNKFMYYVFLAMRKHLINQSYGGGQPNISQDVIKQQYLYHPKKIEQEKIVEYLDIEVEKINSLKKNVSQQIEKLKAYKKSLIYEYVTGKKQVEE